MQNDVNVSVLTRIAEDVCTLITESKKRIEEHENN